MLIIAAGAPCRLQGCKNRLTQGLNSAGSQIWHLRLGIRHLSWEISCLRIEIRHPVLTENLSISVLEYISTTWNDRLM